MPDNVTPEEERLLRPRSAPSAAAPLPRKDGEATGEYLARITRAKKAPAVTQATEVRKEDVSAQEYERRRQLALRRDNSLVAADKERRTTLAIEGWKAKVGATFADAHTERPDVLNNVQRLTTGTGLARTSMVFYGQIGSGKSWQCYAYIAEAMKRGALTPGQIVSGTETGTIGDIAAGGWQRTEKIRQLLEPRNRLYFIDDVGQGYFSREEARTEAWFGLINHVYERQLTLLMTTNLKPTEQSLGSWLGLRAWDRLLSLLGGPGGFTTLGNVNRRPSVAERNEQNYRAGAAGPTGGRRTPF